MPLYVYKALNESGRVLSGVIEADGPKAARATLRNKGIYPTSLKENLKSSRYSKGQDLKTSPYLPDNLLHS